MICLMRNSVRFLRVQSQKVVKIKHQPLIILEWLLTFNHINHIRIVFNKLNIFEKEVDIKMEVSQIKGIECELIPSEIAEYLTKQIEKLFVPWVERVKDDPANFIAVEREVLHFGNVIGGLITGAILSDKETEKGVEREAKGIRRTSEKKWKHVRRTWLTITLLCGLAISIYTPYFVPRRDCNKAGRPRGIGKRGKEGVGIYPELASLGIREGVTASLQEEVARTTIFMPSFELSRQELKHRGIPLDVKKVRRITLELGEHALSARKKDVQLWKDGKLPKGQVFKGKRVVVTIDGGRTRTRENRAGRKTKKGRHRFKTPWREPKLLVIYVVDEKGKRDPAVEQVIETGLQGPEQICELGAYHLHRLGAAEAAEVVFLADGAEWIWNRVPMIAKRACLIRWSAGVDFCHTMGYVGKAVKATLPDKKIHKACNKKIRRILLAGEVDKVLSSLKALPNAETTTEVQDALRYIKNHRALMKYDRLKAKGLPIGSGAVESAVRRVINLRIKSPGMFWDEHNVEAVMYLRANALSGQWEKMLSSVYKYTRTTRQRNWKWNLTPYSIKHAENQIYELPQLVNGEST